jgi:hypothetical protein
MLRYVVACGLLFGLMGPTRAEAPADSLAAWAKKSQGQWSFGVYMKGKKIGWVVAGQKLGKRDSKDVLISTNELYMVILRIGEKSFTADKTTIYYELTGDGNILCAERTKRDDKSVSEYKMVRHGKGMRITAKQDKRNTTRAVAMPRDSLTNTRKFEEWLVSSKRQKGDTFDKYSLDWDQADIDQVVKHLYKGQKTIARARVPEEHANAILPGKGDLNVYELLLEDKGGRWKTEVLPDGNPFSMSMGALFVKREKTDEAKKMDKNLVDMMYLMSVYVERDMGRADQIERVMLEISGLGDYKLPTSHRQILTSDSKKKTTTLELTHDFRIEKAIPLTKEESRRYVRSTPRLQCDQEVIIKQAKKILGDEGNTLVKVRKLVKWVHNTVELSYAANADTAIQVLDSKAGDCKNFTLLFVALARASGIPAREVSGLAFVTGGKPRFAGHAWAEIHDAHQWVTVDPTWNQVYVDGTHIKMAEGKQDLAYLNVLGDIKLKVLEFKKKESKKRELEKNPPPKHSFAPISSSSPGSS